VRMILERMIAGWYRGRVVICPALTPENVAFGAGCRNPRSNLDARASKVVCASSRLRSQQRRGSTRHEILHLFVFYMYGGKRVLVGYTLFITFKKASDQSRMFFPISGAPHVNGSIFRGSMKSLGSMLSRKNG
jgi:hypothetical protein